MYSLPTSDCLRNFVRLIPPRVQWLVTDIKPTTQYHPCFSCKIFLKEFNCGRIHPSFIFLKLLWSVKERKVDFKWHFRRRCRPVSWILQHKRVFKKFFRRKRDAMYLIRKKLLPSLFLGFMLVLCPTQCSNSDVHLTAGYLVAKPLNRSEAEGDLVIRNLLPLMCELFCLRSFSSPSINLTKSPCWKIWQLNT